MSRLFPRKTVAGMLLTSALAALFLAGCRYASGAALTWGSWLGVALFAFATVVTARLTVRQGRIVIPALLGLGLGSGLLYRRTESTGLAWIALGVWFVLLLGFATLWSTEGRLRRWGVRLFLGGFAGAGPVALAQMGSHFAEEEFFVALQAVILSLFWLLLSLAPIGPPVSTAGGRSLRRWGMVLLPLAALLGGGITLHAYQRSFYPRQAPPYPGITAQSPFLCGTVAPASQTYDGLQTFERLKEVVQARQRQGTPEYGWLALATGEERWAQMFRQALLAEARQGRFTTAANSIKFGQFEASLRAYYFSQVREAFPSLFAPDEQDMLRDWFAAINRRAFTVEWVDWMYALALAQWPNGLYENQENGAGLLAILEYADLAAPQLTARNREYLGRTRRGWEARFRNTDDAIVYQGEWIQNAYFQSLYSGLAPEDKQRLSFEWLLLQALPDGAPLRYNHLGALPLTGLAYVGAHLLNDPRYIWLSGRAVEYAAAHGRGAAIQPGAEQPVALSGVSPTQGSCLLYGDSGLPNQIGPLAPDKIVFRSGWSPQAAYLLLNLRFTGWHRYKATNTVSLVYQDGPLLAEVLSGPQFWWLPAGRQLFRDKRVPRENLNGLLIERTGLGAVLYTLTGVGSPWAQDPPYYARVCSFATGEDLDVAHTRLEGWHRWRHDRRIYFYRDGLILVFDEASGPAHRRAAIAWHPTAAGGYTEGRVLLREGDNRAEMVLLPLDAEAGAVRVQREGGGVSAVEYARGGGRLRLLTVFLLGRWVGSEVRYDPVGQSVQVRGAEGQRVIPLPDDTSCEPFSKTAKRPRIEHECANTGTFLRACKPETCAMLHTPPAPPEPGQEPSCAWH